MKVLIALVFIAVTFRRLVASSTINMGDPSGNPSFS